MAQIATRVSEEEKFEIEEYCKKHDIKVSQLIRWAVKTYINEGDGER